MKKEAPYCQPRAMYDDESKLPETLLEKTSPYFYEINYIRDLTLLFSSHFKNNLAFYNLSPDDKIVYLQPTFDEPEAKEIASCINFSVTGDLNGKTAGIYPSLSQGGYRVCLYPPEFTHYLPISYTQASEKDMGNNPAYKNEDLPLTQEENKFISRFYVNTFCNTEELSNEKIIASEMKVPVATIYTHSSEFFIKWKNPEEKKIHNEKINLTDFKIGSTELSIFLENKALFQHDGKRIISSSYHTLLILQIHRLLLKNFIYYRYSPSLYFKETTISESTKPKKPVIFMDSDEVTALDLMNPIVDVQRRHNIQCYFQNVPLLITHWLLLRIMVGQKLGISLIITKCNEKILQEVKENYRQRPEKLKELIEQGFISGQNEKGELITLTQGLRSKCINFVGECYFFTGSVIPQPNKEDDDLFIHVAESNDSGFLLCTMTKKNFPVYTARIPTNLFSAKELQSPINPNNFNFQQIILKRLVESHAVPPNTSPYGTEAPGDLPLCALELFLAILPQSGRRAVFLKKENCDDNHFNQTMRVSDMLGEVKSNLAGKTVAQVFKNWGLLCDEKGILNPIESTFLQEMIESLPAYCQKLYVIALNVVKSLYFLKKIEFQQQDGNISQLDSCSQLIFNKLVVPKTLITKGSCLVYKENKKFFLVSLTGKKDLSLIKSSDEFLNYFSVRYPRLEPRITLKFFPTEAKISAEVTADTFISKGSDIDIHQAVQFIFKQVRGTVHFLIAGFGDDVNSFSPPGDKGGALRALQRIAYSLIIILSQVLGSYGFYGMNKAQQDKFIETNKWLTEPIITVQNASNGFGFGDTYYRILVQIMGYLAEALQEWSLDFLIPQIKSALIPTPAQTAETKEYEPTYKKLSTGAFFPDFVSSSSLLDKQGHLTFTQRWKITASQAIGFLPLNSMSSGSSSTSSSSSISSTLS